MGRPRLVLAGLVPAIHALPLMPVERKAWVPATSAGMTQDRATKRTKPRAKAGFCGIDFLNIKA
jgi:hypothetical protein